MVMVCIDVTRRDTLALLYTQYGRYGSNRALSPGTIHLSHVVHSEAAAVLAEEELGAGDVVALQESSLPLALRRPLPLVVRVQHRVRLHPHAKAALVGCRESCHLYSLMP